MKALDELREWTRTHTVNCSDNRIALVAIADRIDAERQKALDEWRAEHGQMWLKGYSECHAELMEGNETLASDLERCGWVRLPVDADGVPWYRGSKVIDPKDPDGKVNTVWIAGDNTLITDDHLFIFHANELRHYHPPTVEDVLFDLIEQAENEEDREGLVEAFSQRLRLAD